jgi:pseudomonalisin/xanthomonalisin
MRRPSRIAVLGALALAAAAACGGAHAQGWAATRTSRPDTGAATPGALMQPGEAVRVYVALSVRDKPALDALTDALARGTSTRHLTHAEFMARHAPSPGQVDAVVAHLRDAGFTGIEVAGNRMLVTAAGTAAAVKAAFNTDLRHFVVDGRDAYANTSDAQVPAHLAGVVNAVLGLQTVHRHHVMARRFEGATTFDKVGHQPTDFPVLYDAASLPSATRSTIGIISEGDITQSLADLAAFASDAGYPAPTTKKVIADFPGSDTSGVIEWDIDSQSSLAMAGGTVQSVNFYVASTLDDGPLVAAYNAAVTDDTAQAVNVSIGECELNAKSSGHEAAADAVFQVGMAQGQVFTVASGDSGSYQCGSKLGGGSFPAVSPYVIAVGGTTLVTTGATTYVSESLWGCSSLIGCELGGGAGGGTSKTEPAPSWQVASGVLGGGTMRGEPDVSFDADPATGMIVTFGSQRPQYGGTSLAAPIFAGAWVRLQSQNGNTLGFPAAQLYQVGVTPTGARFLHDVTAGSNGGYSAGPGWDAASGFGSIDVGKLARLIKASKG